MIYRIESYNRYGVKSTKYFWKYDNLVKFVKETKQRYWCTELTWLGKILIG